MPRSTWTQNNFNSGEWTPLTYGRSDVPNYKNALAECKNYVPTAQGSLTRRPGTEFIAQAKVVSPFYKNRLLPFEFSVTQAYILEFGHQYVRFYTNDARLDTSGVAAYNVATAYVVGDLVKSSGTVYYCIAANTGNTPPNTTYWYAQDASTAAGSDSIYEIPMPYGESDLAEITYAQSADVLYLAHPNYPPYKLQRLGATNWVMTKISVLDGPYEKLNTTATTLQSSVTTGSATVTASAITGINNGTGFQTTDVGRIVRLKVGSNWAWGIITVRTSTTVVTVSWQTTVGGTTASANWRLGVWFGTAGSTSANYPRAVCFNQDRLVFAGPRNYPNRIDASNTADYENFAPSDAAGVITDANALAFSLNSTKVNTILWMVSDEWGLLAGTASGEWVVAASSLQTAMTPTNVTAKMTTAYGSANVPPVKMGKSTLFVQRNQRKLREMGYQFTIGTFQAPDISLTSEHLTKGGIAEMTAQKAPHPILWMAKKDGSLVGMSYDKDQEIVGWHQHELGGVGYLITGAVIDPTSYPFVLSVATIPSTDGLRDDLWLCVQRFIDGQEFVSVEKMARFWEDGFTSSDAFYVDMGATYDEEIRYIRNVSNTSVYCIGVTTSHDTLRDHGLVDGNSYYLKFDDPTLNGTYVVTVISSTDFTINFATPGSSDLDSGYGGVATKTVSGLTWLAGETVKVLLDGAVHPDVTVSAGGVATLQYWGRIIHLGYGYNSEGKTLRIEAGGGDGTAQGKLKRIHRAIFRFFQSVGLKVRATGQSTYVEPFRSSADLMDNPIGLYTGDKRWAWDGSYELEGQLEWIQEDPLPSNILQIVAQLDTQDGG